MKYVYTGIFVLLFGAFVLGQGGASKYAYAHEGEEHEEVTLTLEEMEDLIGKLRQIIQLLTLRNQLQRSIQTPSEPTHAEDIMEDHHAMDTEEGEKMEDHGMMSDEPDDDHHEDTATGSPSTQKLIIEVETHNGTTHVHARFADGTESMFFVSAPLTDEDGIVRETTAKIGLSESDVRAAIVYTGM
jgi:hypothetical protein